MKTQIIESCSPLEFVGELVHTRGYMNLFIFVISKVNQTLKVRYILVEVDNSYNVLIR